MTGLSNAAQSTPCCQWLLQFVMFLVSFFPLTSFSSLLAFSTFRPFARPSCESRRYKKECEKSLQDWENSILKRKAKFKMVTRIDLRGGDHHPLGTLNHEDRYALDELENSFAFNPAGFLNKPRMSISGSAGKAISTLHKTAEAVQNPKKFIKARAASKLSKTARPYLSRKADLDFLEAHDDLAEAKADENAEDAESPIEADKIDHCQSRVNSLQETRDTMRIAWMTGRHVSRVRAVDADPRSFPRDEYFEEEDDCGATEYQWGRWLGYKLLHYSRPFTAQYIDDFEELPYSSDTLRNHVERLITVSAPGMFIYRQEASFADPISSTNLHFQDTVHLSLG